MKRTDYEINPEQMFSGQLSFLANDYPCRIQMSVLGHSYVFQNAEAAFQAGKCLNPMQVAQIAQTADPSKARQMGKRVTVRSDWETYRVAWMKQVLKCKFTQNDLLMRKLTSTYPLPLSNTNLTGDTFWGISSGSGKNHLGRILMEIREEYREHGIDPVGLDVLQFDHMPDGAFPWD